MDPRQGQVAQVGLQGAFEVAQVGLQGAFEVAHVGLQGAFEVAPVGLSARLWFLVMRRDKEGSHSSQPAPSAQAPIRPRG